MVFPRRLQAVADRLATGQFRLGLEEFRRIYDDGAYVDRALMAEFLLRTGDQLNAQKLVQNTIGLPNIPGSVKARLYEHLAHLVRQRQGLGESIRLYEKSLDLAVGAKDLEQVCRTQLWMMAAKADAHGPEAVGALPSEVVSNVMKLGNAHLRLFLHTTFAEVEGRRACFELAGRHIDVATALLAKHQNLWIEARLSLLCGALAAATSDLEAATSYTSRALEVARESGCSPVESAAICNLGQLYVMAGRGDEARAYLQEARNLTRDVRSQRYAVIDSLAQLELLDGQLEECQAWLTHLPADDQERRYNDLDNEVTRLRLFQKRGDFAAALGVADSGIAAALQRSAHLLHATYRIRRADVLVDMGRVEEADEALRQVDGLIAKTSLTNVAEFERVQGRIAVRLGSETRARERFERAARILTYLGYVSSHRELVHQSTRELNDAQETTHNHADALRIDHATSHVASCESLVSTSRILELGRKPVLLGLEAVELIRQSGAAVRIALVAGGEEPEVVRSVHWPERHAMEHPGALLRFPFGVAERDHYELLVEPAGQLGAHEVIQSVFSLVSAAMELHDARRERSERTSLWPTDVAFRDTGAMFYSEKMRAVRQQALRMAGTDLKILITGETGVGKEIIARLIHKASKRSEKRFVAVNCSTVPRELFEAHLFGHRKGAFTGAIADSLGVIRANDGGTIFFDEVGEMTQDMQVKLLRVLDAREVHPLGATQAVPVDFRAIAATNADLHQLIEEKRFRDDLFYRLNVATLRVPPLRERREEILPFVHYFLGLFSAENDKPVPNLSDEAGEYLLLYNWPGNVRELRNEMERVAGLIDSGARVKVSDLKPEIVAARRARQPQVEAGPNECVVRIDQPLERAYDEIARRAIVAALKRNNGNLEATAKDLGLTRKGLYNKRLRFGML